MKLPNKMLALVQEDSSLPVQLKELDVPTPKKGEVLIKMEYSPINPSDLAMLEGSYAEKPNYPLIPGIEGSGTVVAHGGGFIAKMRMGKRVSCTSTKGNGGVWSEYVCTSAMHCIPLKKHISFEEGASLIVNPLSALAFIDIAKKGSHQAMVNTAAASALGKMLINLAKDNNIQLINIVRRQSQLNDLKTFGAKYVLNSTDENFVEDFKNLSAELNANLIFDAVTGELTPILLNAAPENSKIYLYAKLDPSFMEIDQVQIVQLGKEIKGFFLGKYSEQKGIIKSLSDVKKIQNMIGNQINTDIHKVISLKDANEAIATYKSEMSKGKILLKIGS